MISSFQRYFFRKLGNIFGNQEKSLGNWATFSGNQETFSENRETLLLMKIKINLAIIKIIQKFISIVPLISFIFCRLPRPQRCSFCKGCFLALRKGQKTTMCRFCSSRLHEYCTFNCACLA